MKPHKLKRCPVCGMRPKIKVEQNMGATCTIQCKPLFGKPHLIVRASKNLPERALDIAMREWQRRASNGTE